MKFILFTLLVVSFIAPANSSINNYIENFDLRSYRPQNIGLKDFTVEIRVENLKDIINENFSMIKVKDIYFKLYWLFPGKVSVAVYGLPNGFKELKKNLSQVVLDKINFIIPSKLSTMTRSYKLSTSTKDETIKVLAKDITKRKYISEMDFHFHKDGLLKKMAASSISGKSTMDYTVRTTSWSNNKWVLKTLTEEKILKQGKIVKETNIKHNKYGGYGFPEIINTKSKFLIKNKKGSFNETKNVLTSMNFKNYQVNLGKAYNHFSKSRKNKK